MKRKLAMMLLCSVVTIAAWAQSAIKGTVTDMNGAFSINTQPGRFYVA